MIMGSDFGDVIERGSTTIPNSDIPKREERKPSPKAQGTTILQMVEEMNIEGMSDRLNPEMKEKVLVPLANLLDKYGVSESLTESTTAQSTMGLMGLIGDVAPVIKGLAEYISGQRNSLRDEDKEFLERIKQAQGDSDMSDLFLSESEPETPPTSQNLVGPRGENLNAIDVVAGEVDWWAVMGAENPTEKSNGMSPQLTEAFFAKDVGSKLPDFNISNDKPSLLGLESVEDMAANKGIAYDEVDKADSKYKEIDKAEEEMMTTLEDVIGEAETEVPQNDGGDDIFSEPSDLLGEMDMDDFNISLESED
jgi:hypothetical protein